MSKLRDCDQPYANLPAAHYWKEQVGGNSLDQINYEPAPKWHFDIGSDAFATAGSCFAQHFQRHIKARNGNYVMTEQRHPLMSASANLGYGLFSARYGNIYTCRQLRELVEQAIGERAPIFDFYQSTSKKWIDMCRLRAVPEGFSSASLAHDDRLYHLSRVVEMFREASVFIFTLGLTEAWINAQEDFVYPACPGIVEGAYDPKKHRFINFSFEECLTDLEIACRLIRKINPEIRILLTVSPVMLVATYESRGALQSSFASKAILRAVADQAMRSFEFVDYFPSYEIVAGPQSHGRFYKFDLRDVSSEGVDKVMAVFFASRFASAPLASSSVLTSKASIETSTLPIEEVNPFDAECDEVLLGKKIG